MQLNSIRFKASVLYSLILAVILIIFSSIVYHSVRMALFRDLDNELRIKAEEVATILHAYEKVKRFEAQSLGDILDILRGKGIDNSKRMIVDDLWRSRFDVLNLKNDYINVLNLNGHQILKSKNFTREINALFEKQFPFSLKSVVYRTLIKDKLKLRAVNLQVTYRRFPLVIQVGTPLSPVIKILNNILFFIIAAVAVLLVLTSFVGSIFAHNALKPVNAVTNLADKITYMNLHERIQEQQADAEMEQLVNSFNVMIGRLENSFNHINEFSSHVAHELKTPLAIIKGEIELALSKDRDSEEYRKVFADCLEEIDRIIKIIRDLLLLAKLDYKPEVFKFEKLNLTQFIAEIYEYSEVLASSKNIETKLNIPNANIFVKGDKIHLRRLFLNLINNAVKFTPARGKVDISLTMKDSSAYIDITDTGEGIQEENLHKIFNKFFRVYNNEQTPESGTGLGLNIALSIAKAHKGDIKVTSQLLNGTTFTTILPLA